MEKRGVNGFIGGTKTLFWFSRILRPSRRNANKKTLPRDDCAASPELARFFSAFPPSCSRTGFLGLCRASGAHPARVPAAREQIRPRPPAQLPMHLHCPTVPASAPLRPTPPFSRRSRSVRASERRRNPPEASPPASPHPKKLTKRQHRSILCRHDHELRRQGDGAPVPPRTSP